MQTDAFTPARDGVPAQMASFSGPYDIAISLRFIETSKEMAALKAQLVARGLKVFLCDESPGVNLKRTIFKAISECDLAVIAASKTYGCQTASGFSTYEGARARAPSSHRRRRALH